MAKLMPKQVSGKTSAKARIAVLMASYNDKPSILLQSIHSVLASKQPLDIFLVDDGSATPVKSILTKHLKAIPANLHILRLAANGGLPAALNHGLERILKDDSYTYIARFDSDDIAAPTRFTQQLAFLDKNPDVSLVGCWAEFIDENGDHLYHFNPPTTHKAIRRALYGNNCVLHPSWLARREVFQSQGGYNTSFPIAQDYEFLTRIVAHGHKLSQLPEYLIRYRMSSTNISLSKRRKQLAARFRIQLRHFNAGSPYAWVGIFKTCVLFLTPTPFIQYLKSHLKTYKAQKTN